MSAEIKKVTTREQITNFEFNILKLGETNKEFSLFFVSIDKNALLSR